jgi:hypothetical protein
MTEEKTINYHSSSSNFKILSDGSEFKEYITTSWTHTPQPLKYTIYMYIFSTIVCYIVFNYMDGKNMLLLYRLKGGKDYDQNSELNIIYSRINYWSNFFDSLIFPWTFSKYVIPSIILYFNPPHRNNH